MRIAFLVTDISKSITAVCPRMSLYIRRVAESVAATSACVSALAKFDK
jgi:hypothetical protein